ncbi:MAG: YecR-like lipofamily protein [Azoarcus sp.]|nr:YecR-like lipofamily protein [Azoarcus sp.]
MQQAAAIKRCGELGFKGAQPFGEDQHVCVRSHTNGGCASMRTTSKFQCTH